MEEELERLRDQRARALSGANKKKARQKLKKLDKKIGELERGMALDLASTPDSASAPTKTSRTERGGRPKKGPVLEASALPPFEPPVRLVNCINGPMTPLQWAFTCCVPPLLRPQVCSQSVRGLASNVSPNLQWNYSMFHLAHHFETDSSTKFTIQDDEGSAGILLQITRLRSCPESHGEMGELSRNDFSSPDEDRTSLGPVPLLFVRYFYQTKSDWAGSVRAKAMQRGGAIYEHSKGGGPFVTIRAASKEEVEFAHKELKRGQQFLGHRSQSSNRDGMFEESVLFPPAREDLSNKKKASKAKRICAFCEKRPDSGSSLRSCSCCKVTFYCSKDCQRAHWKAGHKDVCSESEVAPVSQTSTSESVRPSFTFDALKTSQAGLHADANGKAFFNITENYRTGRLTSNVTDKSRRRQGMGKIPTTRNVHGDKEFIVKLQPPLPLPGGPSDWMCYDGPARSFQATLPGDTPGLMEARAILEKEGLWSVHPQLGIPGVKGYFMARWEGSCIRVYYDRLAPTQSW